MATVVKDRDRTEHRWPAVGAVLVALALYALLPSSFLPALRYSVVGFCVLLLIPVIAINPVRLSKETRWSRWFSVGLTIVLAIANHVALVQLVVQLVQAKSDDSGTLLLAATQVWVTLVIVYALIYWEMDRGGPVTRTTMKRSDLPVADIRFPQDEDADAVVEVAKGSSEKSDWTASFVDYAYFALSNSMAFSPPDAMPLSARAKILVGLQALAAYVVLVLVIARAVSLLG
jgi:heme/copper-type cytochrome/quinol oxidase subunit 4